MASGRSGRRGGRSPAARSARGGARRCARAGSFGRLLLVTAALAGIAGSGAGLTGTRLTASGLTAENASDLRQLSLEELLEIQVTSVSKKPESLAEAAAAIFVLSGDEIRRSGATSLAEALRLVPGLVVARTDAQTWAISARGFNSTAANKLEVLLDGRSLYTPLFSGVFWDAQDTLLEDIDRIEVIRGPGATLWGANAVNGVINILTKSARETTGSWVTLGAGSEERALASARHGFELGENAALRVWGKAFDRDPSELADGADAGDAWHMARAGFRLDRERDGGERFTFQGDFYRGRADTLDPLQGLGEVTAADETEIGGGYLLTRWRWPRADGGETQLQAYYDRTHRDIPRIFAEDRDIVDVDFQSRRPLGRHELIWGLGYRLSSDDVANTEVISWIPPSRDLQTFGAFAQDEVAFAGGRGAVTFGSKLEHNDYTGFEVQPSIRWRWRVGEGQILWGALSRAVRAPTRLDSDIRLDVQLSEDPPLLFALLGGGREFESEELVSWEAGYRAQPRPTLSVDLAAYYNDYDELRSVEGPGAPFFEDGVPVLPFVFANGLRGTSAGGELTVLWQPAARWRLHASWSYLDLDLELAPGSTDTGSVAAAGNDPRHQLLLRWLWDVDRRWSFDGSLRWVDELPNLEVEDYAELDLRLAYHASDRLTLALAGRSLLDRRHFEWDPTSATAVERGVYGTVSWRF